MKTFLFLMIAAILGVSCHAVTAGAQNAPVPAPESAAAASFPEYKIGSENVLRIDVYYGKNVQISQRVQVSSAGNINFPIVGEVPVAGLTVPQIEKKIKELIEKDQSVYLQVTVFVEEYSTVIIMGEVKKPGAYPVKGRLTIVELVALAEGFNDAASPNEIRVIHTNPDGSRNENVVRVYDIINKGSGENQSLLLRPGDVVVVPRSTVTIIGEVKKPGVYPTKGSLSVIELIALAEGEGKFAELNEVKVIHTAPDGKRAINVVRVHDLINKGGMDDKNILLQSGDVVIVP